MNSICVEYMHIILLYDLTSLIILINIQLLEELFINLNSVGASDK